MLCQMPTLRLTIPVDTLDNSGPDAALNTAAELLRSGQLVAFPTETVYGLGANALDEMAVALIFAAKQRPAWDPVIVHIASWPMLEEVIAPLPERTLRRVRLLQEAFWPGPLTLLLPRSARVPENVTAGRELVGVRWPAHPVAAELIARAGVPIAAPSANRFGHISPTTAQHVLDDLDGSIAAVVDSGPTRVGVESTVLDIMQSPVKIYRPGGITREEIAGVLGEEVDVHAPATLLTDPTEPLPSPGLDMRHYAPSARLVLVESEPGLRAASLANPRAGVMLPAGWQIKSGAVTYSWGNWNDAASLARTLYDGLRRLDAQGVPAILCPVPPAAEDTVALRDRLYKAARET